MNFGQLTFVSVLCVAATCFASFVWAIVGFFRHGGRTPPRMRLVAATGLASMAGHLTGLVFIPSASGSRLVMAVLLYAASLGLFWWALWTAWKSRLAIAFSESASSFLLQHGPYRYVRHPIYAAYLLAWLAGACAVDAWWAWLPLVVMSAQYLTAIRFEERQFLNGPMSREYQEYQRKTGMLAPNPLKVLTESILRSA
jgi:protein-S-isoprenylcysteine O-methyltransferase Ste14